jgi:hypothetical protein
MNSDIVQQPDISKLCGNTDGNMAIYCLHKNEIVLLHNLHRHQNPFNTQMKSLLKLIDVLMFLE